MSVIKVYREHKYGTLYKKNSFLFFLLDVGYDNRQEIE
jgi:hypothetical protein